MPSVYSRLAPYLTPSWVLVLLSGFIAFRLAVRSYSGAMARAQLARNQAAKRARMQGQMAVMEVAIEQTAAQRTEQGRGELIVKESATEIVKKLRDGQTEGTTPMRVPGRHATLRTRRVAHLTCSLC